MCNYTSLLTHAFRFQCIGSGVCGGGGGCYSPPPVSCGGGCSPGYSCGHYGCARRRARAHGSNTVLAVEEQQQQRPALFGAQRFRHKSAQPAGSAGGDPNQMFLECCEDRGLPDACLSKCNFNRYTKESVSAGQGSVGLRSSGQILRSRSSESAQIHSSTQNRVYGQDQTLLCFS